jgi:GntR family transcriptional regulator/MocR family aminotransferase
LTSRTAEILLAVDREAPESLSAQIERQIREAVRNGALRPGAAVPSMRDLARELAISRPTVMEAYAQLAAEGYLALRQGAGPKVADLVPRETAAVIAPPAARIELRYSFRTGTPDLTSFPRSRWAKATVAALAKMETEEFGYGYRHGAAPLRQALVDYLGRVRGVTADPSQVLIIGGFDQARSFMAEALRQRGVKRIAVEDPGYGDRQVFLGSGFELIPIPLDDDGLRVDLLEATNAEAVLVTPAHQYPTGVVMSGARRLELASWLQKRGAIALEDDYDAEYRFDRAPIGALQGLAPEHVVYAGTVSKTLAPALRLGWLVVPPQLLETLMTIQHLADNGRSRLEQHVLAEFIISGDFDRHLRKMRGIYRDRRSALLGAIAQELPDASVGGVSAGLHACVALPQRVDEPAILAAAARRGVEFGFMTPHYLGPQPDHSTMLLSYARMSESDIRAGVRGLKAALEST